MASTLRLSGSLWVDASSGEVVSHEDLAELLSQLPDGATLRVLFPDEDDDEDTLHDAFSV